MKAFEGYRLITPNDLTWRPSNLMRIPNADYLERTGSENLGARLWRLPPHSANTLHRHCGDTDIPVCAAQVTDLRMQLVFSQSYKGPFSETSKTQVTDLRHAQTEGRPPCRPFCVTEIEAVPVRMTLDSPPSL